MYYHDNLFLRVNNTNYYLTCSRGWSALHFAAEAGKTEVASFLITSGADVNAKNRLNATPLLFAAENGNVELIKLLLSRGANPLAKANFEDDESGIPPSITALMWATKTGSAEAVRLLLERGANPTQKDYYGRTALQIATTFGHKHLTSLLASYSNQNHR